MASTNKTTNYQLSQFQNSDIPAWLTDYNGDMQKIDAGIHAAKAQADGAASGVSLLQTAVSGKQDKLTFDSSPIAGSQNPVTSAGIYNALQNAQIQTDAVPTAGSTKAVQSGGVYTALQGKQNNLTFDDTPTENSNNPVTSGGVYNAIQDGVGGWNSVVIVPFQQNPNNPVVKSTTETLVVPLPIAMKAGKAYEVIIENFGISVSESGTTIPISLELRFKLDGVTVSGDDITLDASDDYYNSSPFPNYNKTIISPDGYHKTDCGTRLVYRDGTIKPVDEWNNSLQGSSCLPVNSDANQISVRYIASSKSPKYYYGAIMHYRAVY